MKKTEKSKLSHEAKVGLLFCSALVLVALFTYFFGSYRPFSRNYRLQVVYNYAGGLEVGSPVRVSGIKVGKVTKIEFFVPDAKTAPENQSRSAKLRVVLSIDSKARQNIRKDSQFFINVAGIIGERYVEITPGSVEKAVLNEGSTVAGIDPPRFDQLLSQSYGFFGELEALLKENKGSFSRAVAQLSTLIDSMHKTLAEVDSKTNRTRGESLMENLTLLSEDLRLLTSELRKIQDKGNLAGRLDTLLTRIDTLTTRAEALDKEAIRKFLQEEQLSVKAKVDLF
ncbi:MAG: MCE family protein [Deltaproteobacteria bacterium]|nr:MCE family protein [Deltaproteobacteria bacterium]